MKSVRMGGNWCKCHSSDAAECLGIKRKGRVSNARIREFCGVAKGIDEWSDESVLCCFGNIERMEKNSIAKRVYVGECVDSRFVDQPQKRWIDFGYDCVKKRG